MAEDPAERFQSAQDLRTALTSLDLGEDDATAMVARETTPPGGTAVPSFARRERSWLVPVVLVVVVAVVFGVVGVLFARTETARRLLHPSDRSPPAPGPLQVSGVRSFDPDGDGREHDGELGALHDRDPSTTWDTERYGDSRFGGLKDGVGVIVELERPRALAELRVTAVESGWEARVYLAEASRPSLGAWGPPVAGVRGDARTARLDLGRRQAGAVLLWITRLGPGGSLELAELELSGG